jgi:hypothetical protein
MNNSSGYAAKYRDDPESMLTFCCEKVTFLAEVTRVVPLGAGLELSEEATGGLHRILRDIAKEMVDSMEELSRQRKGDNTVR